MKELKNHWTNLKTIIPIEHLQMWRLNQTIKTDPISNLTYIQA